MGADLAHASAWTLGRAEERLFRGLDGPGAGGVAARLARTLLFDAPVAWWLGVAQHEAFGHGGRARELGSSASVHLGSPWGGRESFASFDPDGLSNEDLLRVYTGGSESNGWTATRLERRLVAGDTMHPMELLLLAGSRFVTSDYVLRTTPDPRREPARFFAEWQGGGDVANYLGFLHRRFEPTAGIAPGGSTHGVIRQWRRLRRQAIWNALDPGAWLSLAAVGGAVYSGGEPIHPALPRLRGRTFLPVLSSDWLPDGGVASLEILIGPKSASGGTIRQTDRAAGPADSSVEGARAGGAQPPGAARWMAFTMRRGRGPEGALGAIGAATERLLDAGPVRLGGEAEIWTRSRHGPGGGARLRFNAARGLWRGLFLDAGVKSDGHWPGRPAATGPFVLIGVEFPG